MNTAWRRPGGVVGRIIAIACLAVPLAACSDEASGPTAPRAAAATPVGMGLARIIVSDARERLVPSLVVSASADPIAATLHELSVHLERANAAEALRAVGRAERAIAASIEDPEIAAIGLALAAVRSLLGAAH